MDDHVQKVILNSPDLKDECKLPFLRQNHDPYQFSMKPSGNHGRNSTFGDRTKRYGSVIDVKTKKNEKNFDLGSLKSHAPRTFKKLDGYGQSPNPVISPGFHELKNKKRDQLISLKKELELQLRNVVTESKKTVNERKSFKTVVDRSADRTQNISQLKLELASIDALEKKSPLKSITNSNKKNMSFKAESIKS